MSFIEGRRLALWASLMGASVWSMSADQIMMKNGDRVTGVIVKQDGKKLTIKSDRFGEVSTAWDQVDSIKTERPVTVVLQDGRTVQGTVTTSNGQIAVAAPTGTVTAAPAQVTAIRGESEQRAYERLQNPGLGELWTGSASLGLAGTSGNARTVTFTTGVDASRTTKTDKISVTFSAIKASASVNGQNSDTAQAVRGGISYDHNLSPRLFLNVFNEDEYDRFQNLDLRFVVGLGAGFHALKSDRTSIDLLAGVDYNHSKFSTPLTRNSAEFFWGDDYAYKLTGSTSLVQSFRMFNDLSHTGDYRVNFDIGAATRIGKWLSWNVALSDRYLNHPAPGRKTNDFLYTTGLGITFAR